ncbi:hypothetical protein K2173_011359 [Erythroxylum novogranatense]|uniref:Bifunctional inhibitor/plant lipid transfer protein/seed storage helical domain-containing protein n=1 Tax=Erythroxylum novogranatense TaxID=1862640 RepID=A0AAV8S9T2_9ROSI|nr:hypothetical protein K2173_011359 [Erythroxylum novogranatense]
MAVLNLIIINYIVLAVFAISAISSISRDNLVLGQACQADLNRLASQCASFVRKQGPVVDPSQACCGVVKSVDVPCVCKLITKEAERFIDLGKVAHVLDFCGKPLHGMKCGTIFLKVIIP